MERASTAAGSITAPSQNKYALGKRIMRLFRDFSYLLWKFSKKFMWFSSTSNLFRF